MKFAAFTTDITLLKTVSYRFDLDGTVLNSQKIYAT